MARTIGWRMRTLVTFQALLLAGCGGSSANESPDADPVLDSLLVADAELDGDSGRAVEDTSTPLDTGTFTDGGSDTFVLDTADTSSAETTDTPTDTGLTDTGITPTCAAIATCPGVPAGLVEGNGPVAIELCAFALKDSGRSPGYATAIDGLAKVLKAKTVTDVLADLNRNAAPIAAAKIGVPGFVRGFAWNTEDETKAWWIPQGLSGSMDANTTGTIAGRKVVLVSWYHDVTKQPGATEKKGVRIAMVDVTTGTPTYRHLLLVEPKMVAGRPDYVAVPIHAGGIAWVGDKLYVADTGTGLRIFDLARIFAVNTALDMIGWDAATSSYYGGQYAYIVPQVGTWIDPTACSAVFSWVALDRSTTPPSLLTGEYDAAAITGRAMRWPLEGPGDTLSPLTYASAAYVMAQRQVQGGVSSGKTLWFSSSKPAAGAGALYATEPGKKTLTYTWVDAPEDLMFDPKTNQLWGTSEGEGARYVFAVDATKVKGP